MAKLDAKRLDRRAIESRINPKSLERQAADAIRSSVLKGVYPPGARLTEIKLADDLGLSRGTIRGALQELAHEGLLHLAPYRGWSVVSLSAKDAWEIYTLRNALEGLASRILAENITPARAARIEESLDLFKAAVNTGKREQIIRADFELHCLIMELSGHSRLLAQYQIIQKQTLMFVALAGAYLQMNNYVELHSELIAAIKSGKPQLAEKLASSHNTVDGKALVKRLREMEDQGARGKRKKLPPVEELDVANWV